ncbi:MAG: hypothetical protein ACE5GA_00385, partial [Candidatus Zixiibacteriota bacterium]
MTPNADTSASRLPALRRLLLFVTLSFSLLILVDSVLAVEFDSGKKVSYPEGSFIDDDLIISGSHCSLGGRVDGDVVAVGKTVRASGTITGALIAGGSNVVVSGDVQHSMVGLGETVFIEGNVHGTAYALGESVEIGSEARLQRDLRFMCSQLILEGDVKGDVKGECRLALISGVIDGDLDLTAEEVEVRESALIKGDLIVYCEKKDLYIEDESSVLGEIVRRSPEKSVARGFAISTFVTFLCFILTAFVIGILIIAVSRDHARRASEAALTQPLRSAAFGILTFGGALVLSFILFVTLVGIPASFLVFSALCWMLVFGGQVYLSVAVGSKVIGQP